MAKYKWTIVKNKDSGEYYPAMDDRDIKWDRDKQSFVSQNNDEIDVLYPLGKVTDSQRDMFWKGFQVGKETIEKDIKKALEEKQIEKFGSYIVLQKDKTRYTFQYDKKNNNYDEKMDELLVTGGTFSSKKLSVEEALEKIEELKRNGFLEFKNPGQISWYASAENNTPYQEIWKEKDGYFLPIESHSVGVFTVNGCSCEKVDEWEEGKKWFILGNAIDDKEFYYAFEKSNRQKVYEFDHRPSRDEVENKHIDFIAEKAINSYEAEFGADGYCVFPGLQDEINVRMNMSEAGKEKEKSHTQVFREVLELAKKELNEAEDSIGYTMPDGKYHLFIYVDESDEKLYVVEPNRVENGAHELFTGDTYLVRYGDFGELMVGCMWAMECFERDKVFEKENEKEIFKAEEISLKDFLHHFDFDYEIVMPNEDGERKHREELLETDDISKNDLDSPMVCLVDLQGANLGDIQGDRFRIDENLVEKIIDRMDVYINDSIVDEFSEALDNRGLDVSSMSFEEMVTKAKEVGVGTGEVSYEMASYVIHPELIDMSVVLEESRQGSKNKEIKKESLDTRIGSVKEGLIKNSENTSKVHSERLERE